MAFRPEASNTGLGRRRFKQDPMPTLSQSLLDELHKPRDPIMHGRKPVQAETGIVDMSGLPLTFASPLPIIGSIAAQAYAQARPRTTASNVAAGRPSGAASLVESRRAPAHSVAGLLTFSRSSSASSLTSKFAPAPLARTSSARWDEIRRELGETREEVFLGNNLRDTRTQSFINLLRPQEAAGQPPRVTPSRVGAFPTNVKGTLPEDAKMDVARFYRTTNSSTYGNFADIPSLPNTTGPIRQPLYLTSGMGERREA